MLHKNKLLIKTAIFGMFLYFAQTQTESFKVHVSAGLFKDNIAREESIEVPDNPRYSDIKKAIARKIHTNNFMVEFKNTKTKQLESLKGKLARKRIGDREKFWSEFGNEMLYVTPHMYKGSILEEENMPTMSAEDEGEMPEEGTMRIQPHTRY